MSFGEHYINVFTVLKNLGLLSEQPVRTAEGLEVVPLKGGQAVLPDPASLAPGYTGKTCIGDLVKGTKNGQPRELFIYNVATMKRPTPRRTAKASLLHRRRATGCRGAADRPCEWDAKRMVNVEELPAQPFLEAARCDGPAHSHQGRAWRSSWDQHLIPVC